MTNSLGQNAPDLAGFSGFDRVPTPAVVLNGAGLARNIAAMQQKADNNVALHPHIKTHKSIALARRQIAAGALGITVSRPAEARRFIAAGIAMITIAYPVIDKTIVLDLQTLSARHGVTLRFVVDSTAGIVALSEAAQATGLAARAFIEVDVGLKRCGVDPTSDEALTLAVEMQARGIELLGLFSHAGQSYGAADPTGVAAIAASERTILVGLQQRLVAAGLAAPSLSVGSTPTALADAGFMGLHELRPGNYIFLDLTAARLGIARRADIALAVAASVISANDRYAIVDAGSKTLSSDLGPHGTRVGSGFGEAYRADGSGPWIVEKLSEEHGFIDISAAPLAIGDRLLILPNHACPVVNLASTLMELKDGEASELSVDA